MAWLLVHFGAAVPRGALDLLPGLPAALRRRRESTREDTGWCAALATGPLALALATTAFLLLPALLLPALLFARALLKHAGRLFRAVARLCHQFLA